MVWGFRLEAQWDAVAGEGEGGAVAWEEERDADEPVAEECEEDAEECEGDAGEWEEDAEECGGDAEGWGGDAVAQQAAKQQSPMTQTTRILPPEPAPETVEQAKWQVLRALRTIRPLDVSERREGYKILCRRYHPDKNMELGTEKRKVYLAAFQYLQQGKAALVLDSMI
jgi:hypothetical protein